MTHSNLIDPNAVALRIVQDRRRPIYPGPRLIKGQTVRSMAGSKQAERDRRNRARTRLVYEKLSRYYPLPRDETAWATTRLLPEGRHENDHLM